MIKKKLIRLDGYIPKIIEATCDICGADCMKPIFEPMKSDGDRDEHDINKKFEGMELSGEWASNDKTKDIEIWNAVVCKHCVEKYLSPIINFIKTIY